MWADKSGNTNNPIQSMANQMPRWTPAVLNQKPIVTFDSNFSQIFDIQNSVTDPSFVFLVHRQKQGGQSKVLGGDLSTTSDDGSLHSSMHQVMFRSFPNLQPATGAFHPCVSLQTLNRYGLTDK